MRGRIAFIVLAVLVVGAIAALNWPEFTRAEPLSFGVLTATVPVGVTLLVLMGIVLAVLRERTGCLIAPITVHCVNNCIATVLLVYSR